LDIAKIESGQLPVNIEECDVSILFKELASFFKEHQKRINKKNIQFNLKSHYTPSEFVILTDKVKLKQIFINLISNAFKFTEEGKIEGGCKIDNNHNLLFYVSDTGFGIPPDKQNLIFERFAQLDHGKKHAAGGTGLGLSIVKGLVELLGGKIWLESEAGKGSTFTFSLPFKTTQPKLQETPIADVSMDYNFPDKTILIVEDDYYNAEYLREILTPTGMKIIKCVNGKEAVQMSIAEPIDIVLMDIRLPDINGYEAAHQIKLRKPKIKIIAQTAYASQDEKQKALYAGCNDYISKPTKRELLLTMISQQLKK
jgi:CheY-like chemotaxis protein